MTVRSGKAGGRPPAKARGADRSRRDRDVKGPAPRAVDEERAERIVSPRRRAGTIAGVLGLFIAGCLAGVYSARPTATHDSPATTAKAATPHAGASERVEVELKDVVDGDTISVVLDGRVQKVRYLGIDTPESFASTSSGIEYLGKEAAARNGALVKGRSITLEYDGSRVDRYGRVLAYVWADDVDVCKQLLAEGYAEVYRKAPNIRRYADYLEVEAAARKQCRGVWDAPAKSAWEAAHPTKAKR